MSASERTAHRLFLEAPLAAGEHTACNPEQANYLLNVLRLGAGAEILVFNGRDGEWRACLVEVGKRR
ncbi:MAG: RNA methyltransferase PUA domain-containing protein, partial [Hyphomicrobium sp.]